MTQREMVRKHLSPKDKKREYDRQYKTKKRSEHAAMGLCVNCHQPSLFGYKRCQVCLDSDRESARKYKRAARKVWKEKGLCLRCGKERMDEGTRFCPPCRDYNTKSRRGFYGVS
jgi:hypothetical protein